MLIAAALALALTRNTTLRMIDLSSNGIGARSSESMDQWSAAASDPPPHTPPAPCQRRRHRSPCTHVLPPAPTHLIAIYRTTYY